MIRSSRYRSFRPDHRRRHAMVLICVLVTMGIGVSLTGLMIRSSLRARHQMRIEWQLEQTRWLLDCGVRSVLAESPESNRTIDFTDALPRYANGTLTIRLEPNSMSADGSVNYQITAVIESRDRVPVVTRRTREVRVAGAEEEE